MTLPSPVEAIDTYGWAIVLQDGDWFFVEDKRQRNIVWALFHWHNDAVMSINRRTDGHSGHYPCSCKPKGTILFLYKLVA